ncbi:UNC-like C-terminal-domain-containing protein [Truncatella angustata]|uniref:UNC-like C-terminal-domain-containing protein n=1 Tax=Truncatella angustata TaxID=152316 RepID=A0A9P8UZ68_9PEZI|nr:UNC-like C-terminal-domain-containing protein [Truncatella angustata]KAH6660795.1 UNC-like C-terminal-domain-containing protein [Truncatella angustata]
MLFLRHCAPLIYLLGTAQGQGQSQGSSSTPTPAGDATKTKTATPTAQPTCESRTINYITHTLPQQCLTVSISPATASASTTTSASETSVAVSQTASSIGGDTASGVQGHDPDSDENDLSTGAFMSFEEWKEMMLEKSGQENLEDRPRKSHDGRGQAPGDDYGTMGEEGEISLDFGAYSDKISEITSAGKPAQKDKKEKTDELSAVEKVSYDEGLGHVYRSKDAGKTCKERFNYASFDAGATVLKTNPGTKNSKAILVENKDSYMLMECRTQNKFFIVELSDDVLVDTVVLANFEFFSSMVRQFRVSVSDRYPAKLDKWKVLGEYAARNSRDVQPFLIEHPQIWARYIRIEILNHYGKEFYCPLSLLRVHGTRMLDSWKEADPSDLEAELEGEEETIAIEEAPEILEPAEPVEVVVEETVVEEPARAENQNVELLQSNFEPFWDHSYFQHRFPTYAVCRLDEAPTQSSQHTSETEGHDHTTTSVEPRGTVTAKENKPASVVSSQQSGNTSASANSATSAPSKEQSGGSNTGNRISETTTTYVQSQYSAPGGAHTSSSKPTTTSIPIKASSPTPSTPRSKTAAATSLKPPSSKPASPKASGGTTSRGKTMTATSSSVSASPTVQDSFFKQLTKRLQNLESNTTLSMQYIESQSKFLQEALAKLERRHAAKVDLFLDSLNKTVMTELREFRSQYDQIWQSTVIALESQREKFEHDNLALSTRVGLLADEVVFQKRMAIVQSVLLLGCLVLVVFGRGLGTAGLELYYPSQIQGSFSRLASPLYPSTPKGVRRESAQRRPSTMRGAIEDSTGATPNRGLVSDSDMNETPPRPPPVVRTPTPEPLVRPKGQRHLSLPENRQPLSRTVSEHTGMEFYQPPTPASIDADAGYDSEPPHLPSSPRVDYFSVKTNGDFTDHGDSTPAETTLEHFDKTVRLPRPAPEADDQAEEDAQMIPRAGLPRVPTSAAASVKPLPALPEHSDQSD